MIIRHKTLPDKEIINVERDNKASEFIRTFDYMTERYPYKFWEEVNAPIWTPVEVNVTRSGRDIHHGSSHVGAMLNLNYRAVVPENGTLVIEKLS